MRFNDKYEKLNSGKRVKDITIQVTGDCNLACSYCYLHDKNSKMIDLEIGKRFIDKIVTNDQSFWNGYIDFDLIDAVHLQFIGGEPLCNYKAVIELCDYFKESCEKHGNCRLWKNSAFGICTNGTIYNDEIASLITRYRDKMNVSISIDGTREQHDTCRRFKGSNAPSYDVVVKNLEKYRKLVHPRLPVNTKATVSPENIHTLSDSAISLFTDLNFWKVPMNCMHEDVWSLSDAQELYRQLKKVADWALKEGGTWESMNLESQKIGGAKQFGFFHTGAFRKKDEYEMCSACCGGNGQMVFLQYDGKIYNCNRYSETAVGNSERDLILGDIDSGITEFGNIDFMRAAIACNTFPDVCKQCVIASGCNDCLAYCYEVQGHFDKILSLCDMHKARYLANVYFWNNYFISKGELNYLLISIPISECLKYVSEDELNKLLDISNSRFVKDVKEGRYETRKNFE